MAQSQSNDTDYGALSSPFMRIPRMSVDMARALLDIGVHHIYELEGRSPESLLADLKRIRPEPHEHTLAYFRMAVYFAENQPNPDARQLHPSCWQS